MIRLFISAMFFVSLITLPWYASVMLGIVLIALWKGYVEVILGGILLDAVFGAAPFYLWGVPIFYTALFVLLSLLGMILGRIIME
jgi:hypothetical protein